MFNKLKMMGIGSVEWFTSNSKVQYFNIICVGRQLSRSKSAESEYLGTTRDQCVSGDVMDNNVVKQVNTRQTALLQNPK